MYYYVGIYTYWQLEFEPIYIYYNHDDDDYDDDDNNKTLLLY